MRPVTGHLPNAFGWLVNATYAGQDFFHHLPIDVWALDNGHFRVELGTHAPDNDIPIFYREITPDGEMFVEFYEFTSNASISPEHFNVPSECQTASKKATAPVPPRISENFEAEVAFGVRKGQNETHGYGLWAVDTYNDRSVQHLVFPTPDHHDFIEFELLRFDQHMEYKLSSVNTSDCYEAPLNGTQTPVFDWVQNVSPPWS